MLRIRLGVLMAVILLVALALSALLVDRMFARQQRSDMTGLLQRELDRVTFLVESSTLGQDFLGESSQGLHLQFVTAGGAVVVPAGSPAPLPLAATTGSELVDYLGARVMVVAAPWRLPTGSVIGTVRLGYDAEAALADRSRLRQILLVSAAVIALVSGIVGLLVVGRELRPLAQLARQAARLDPADPKVEFSGPSRGEVGQVRDALTAAVAAIRERQQSERAGLAAIAHELAAPLSVVAGQLESLAARNPDPAVTSARDASRELLYTSQDLLTLARGELALDVQLEQVELASVARRIVGEYRGVTLTVDDEGLLLGSPQRLGQMTRNLVRNAVQAASSPAVVSVRVYREGDEVRLAVSDDGHGLDEEALAHLFDVNFSRRAGGHGLGLPVVKALTEAHAGTVSVESSPGNGATFVLSFPTLEARLSDDDA